MKKSILTLMSLAFSLCALALPPESQIKYKGGVFSLFTNQNLETPNAKIEQAIITIHGSERNANTYYNSIEAMSNKLGVLEKTIVISPHFKEPQDQLLASEFYWSSEGWLSGDDDLKNNSISSFDVLDYVISLLADKKNFPKLKEVVLTGHSAGGQTTQRYAAGSLIDEKYPQIHFRYVVTNPGSYVYLTRNRPVAKKLPCNFNDYKYGLDRLNPYMSRTSLKDIRARYINKDVVYLLGEADVRSDDIDQACPAQYQGNTRLERGRFYKAQLDKEFINKHHIFTVPGVGHTQYGMYTSEVGLKVLFQKL